MARPGSGRGGLTTAKRGTLDLPITAVRITHTGGKLVLVAGSATYPVPSDPSPIVDVLLTLYAGSDEQWTVTLDDLRFA